MTNRVCKALNIRYPIVQGAMAWNSMPELVSAVSNAGGLGVLGSGPMPADIALENIEKIRSMTDNPFGVNVFLDAGPMLEEKAEKLSSANIPVIYIDTLNILTYDFTKKYYDIFKAGGSRIVAKINCLEDAVVAEQCGADVIIAKGLEGGGHKSKIAAGILLAEVLEHIKCVPVMVSGGIATPRQMAGYILMGAEGVEMGTAFIATHESPVHVNYKTGILAARDIDALYLGDCTGEASWQIRNQKAARLDAIEANNVRSVAAELFKKEAAGSGRIAAQTGDTQINGSIMCGATVALIHELATVAQRVKGMCEECEAILRQSATLGL